MRKLTIVLAGALVLGIVVQAARVMAKANAAPPNQSTGQSATTGTATKTPATQNTTNSQTTSKPKTPGTAAQTGRALVTPKDKFSYALGLSIGRNFKEQSIEVNSTLFLQGIKDVLAGAKPLMTDAEVATSLTQMQNDIKAKQAETMKLLAAVNLKEGTAFLAANKTKPGVVTLPSGLQYKILTAGNGPKPTASDTVVCNYRGTLINGKEFDSSFSRGKPETLPVGRVIKGWSEALQLMPVGSKWQLYIPADLAYGDHGAGPDIGPNATLIFDIELISIQGK
jgi:FKBP-type peptidyl-prolyl cis-trans isomerase FklB